MSKPPYPLVDAEFFIQKLLASNKVDQLTYFKVGSTHTVSLVGNKPTYKRIIIVREINGRINFMHATGLAAIHGFIGDLMQWYEDNENWKEGAYIE